MNRRGFPVVLSAASGTGKTTLAQMLLQADPSLTLSVSYTTRSLRGDEKDGRDYHFRDEKEFRRLISESEFIEWAEVHGALYGSSAAWTEKTLNLGSDVLFDIDVQGGMQIQDHFPQACLIFLLPPTMDILQQRLTARGTDSKETVDKRMRAAQSEIEQGLKSYDYVLTNDRLDRAIFDLTSIVRAHRLRTRDRGKVTRRLLQSSETEA
jgi:guanylate kinase